MATRVLPAVTFAAPKTFPTNGYGGSYYSAPAFTVPSYDSTQGIMLSWQIIDEYGHVLINKATTEGIAAGLTWATFVYILALTPNSKRTSPFHSFLLLGVVFLLIHLMMDLISANTPGVSKYAAYNVLINDGYTIFTTRYRAIQAASLVTDMLAFCCASVCLWIQARGLMTGVRPRFYPIYLGVLTVLIWISLAAFTAQIGYTVKSVQKIGSALSEKEQHNIDRWRLARRLSLGISIGSYSLVSMISIISIIWKRPSSLVKGHNNAYASALNLMGFLCAQSFILPVVFSILLIASGAEDWLDPTVVLLPTVFLIVPLGSLFMNVNQNAAEPRKEELGLSKPASPTKLISPNKQRDRSPTLINNIDPNPDLSAFLLDVESGHRMNRNSICSEVDRELAEIDAMNSSPVTKQQHVDRKLSSRGTPRPDSSVLPDKMV